MWRAVACAQERSIGHRVGAELEARSIGKRMRKPYLRPGAMPAHSFAQRV